MDSVIETDRILQMVDNENNQSQLQNQSINANEQSRLRLKKKKNMLSSKSEYRFKTNIKEIDLQNRSIIQKSNISQTINLSAISNLYASDRVEKETEEDNELEKKFIKKINESFEILPEDKHPKDIIGDQAEEEFYQHYKKLDKVAQQNHHFYLQDSVFTSILKTSEQQLLTPCKIGMIRTNGYEDTLKIPNMHFGDKYAEVLTEGLKKIPNITKFNLKGNKITEQGADKLLKIVSKSAKTIDLCENQIGRLGCEHISISLSSKDCKIEYLNLEANKLGDYQSLIVLDAAIKNRTLKYLNLSKNYISDKCGEIIKNLLEIPNQLRELYLHWNNLKGVSGKMIFTGLLENDTLKVFDLSNNNLGSGVPCAEQIAEFLTKNQELRHFDLSHNTFNLESSQIIAKGLEKNKSIYGMHYQGNEGCYVDSRGFIAFDRADQSIDIAEGYFKSRIKGCECVTNQVYKSARDYDLRDCCWICHGWVEVQLEVNVDQIQDRSADDPLFIHFNFENFRGNYFGRQSGSSFTYKRMVPPGDITYFYTTSNSFTPFAAENQKTKSCHDQIIDSVQQHNTLVHDLVINKYNYMSIKKNMDLIKLYQPQNTIEPRTRDPVYVPPLQKKTKKKWRFETSLMYPWKPDNEEKIQKCFEFDWAMCKIPKLIKKEEELNKVKGFLQGKYKYIKETYKHFATINPVMDIWAIQTAPFFDFIKLTQIIDNVQIFDADINIKWTATISGAEKGNPRKPIQAINRYQMMEALVRIAEEKYILKYKLTQSYLEAISMFWEEHLKDICNQYDLQIWRNEKYWNEPCDLCLKHYKKIIDYVYKKFSKKKVKPGQFAFMCLDEVQQIISQCNLMEDESFGSDVYLKAFNYSMMTQIDEINSDRIFQMSLVEYYEALARIAETANLPPFSGLFPEETQWTQEKRKQLPLQFKLESLIMRLYDNFCDFEFKKQNPRPEKSFFWKDPNESEFELVD